MKRKITAHIADPHSVSPDQVVSSVVSALGGLGLGIRNGARGPVGTDAGGRGGRTASASTQRIGGAVAGLGGFASVVRERGLTEALRQLDLRTLEGRPAVEVIARVAERLAEGLDGVDGDILTTALNETILEAAQLEAELGYSDLEVGIQTFLDEQGLAGLIELFLARFVTDLVAAAVFSHVEEKTESEAQSEALLGGIEIVCRAKSRAVVERERAAGAFSRVDWFGPAGRRLGRELANSIVSELKAG